MKVLLTGADGLLGSNVVRELLKRKYDVSVFIEAGKKSKTLPEGKVNIIYGNILNEKEVDEAIQGMDYVIHCAANTNIWPTRSEIIRAVNVDGTENVISACLKHDIKRLISVGTANSFASGGIINPGDETNNYEAHVYNLDYMDSKRLAQDLVIDAVRNKGLKAIVVNPTFMIGPYDSKPSSGAMIQALAQGKIPGFAPGGKNYICVKDAAIGINNALTQGRIGECYILGNENLTYKEIFTKISKTIDQPAPKKSIPGVLIKFLGAVNSRIGKIFKTNPSITKEIAILSCEDHYYSSQKAVSELSLPQTPIEKGVKECYDWFVKHNYLNV